MNWRSFLSAFALIFVAELGDKTQLAVFAQTCKHRRPWAVFVGASAALGAVTALGVIAGQAIGRLVPPALLRVAASLAFVVMGLLITREAARGRARIRSQQLDEGRLCNLEGEEKEETSSAGWSWQAFSGTFGLLFLAELGDKTQLAVLGLAGEPGDAWATFGGAALALTTVTAVGVVGGRVLCDLVPQRTLLWLSAVAFLVMAVLVGFGVL